jgi:hypothetical protein
VERVLVGHQSRRLEWDLSHMRFSAALKAATA